jgi:hypothetical protein
MQHQKMIFWLTFIGITLKVRPSRHPTHPPSACFYCYFRPPESGRGPDGLWSKVQHVLRSGFQSVSGSSHTECGGGWFSVGSAFSLFLTELMVLHHSGKFLKPKRAIIYLANTGEINLHFMTSRSKLSRPWYLTVLLDPVYVIRVIVHM